NAAAGLVLSISLVLGMGCADRLPVEAASTNRTLSNVGTDAFQLPEREVRDDGLIVILLCSAAVAGLQEAAAWSARAGNTFLRAYLDSSIHWRPNAAFAVPRGGPSYEN